MTGELVKESAMLAPSMRIHVAGHRGMVGAAIVRRLEQCGCAHIITRTHAELDLTSQADVRQFFRREAIDYVVLAAARVGGIHANSTIRRVHPHQPDDRGQRHPRGLAGRSQAPAVLGSSCIYPKFAPQPMREEDLLTGILEPTNEPYAIAKIAGIKMCEAYNRQYGTCYRSVMPTNLYGPGDNYHLENSHVIPAMIRKYHLARLAAEGAVEAIRRDAREVVLGGMEPWVVRLNALWPGLLDRLLRKQTEVVRRFARRVP